MDPEASLGEPAHNRIGQLVADRYRLQRPLGTGAMGDVYAAVHAFTRKHVAVKLLSQRAAESVVSLERFLREARAAAAIGHPSICDVLDAGKDTDGTLYLVLELLEGEDLGTALERGDLTLREILEVGAQTLDGLAAAHERGIIHRDIKPDNLFLTRDEEGELRVKILDFGIAKRLNAKPSLVETQDGMMVGTPYYMSPEQAGAEDLDGRTDIYSMGAVLFHAFAGRPPHFEKQYNRLVAKILTAEAPSLATFRSDLPDWLVGVVDCALSQNRVGRFPSARQMATALREETFSELSLDWDEGEGLTQQSTSPFASPFSRNSSRPPALIAEARARPRAAKRRAKVDELAATAAGADSDSDDDPDGDDPVIPETMIPVERAPEPAETPPEASPVPPEAAPAPRAERHIETDDHPALRVAPRRNPVWAIAAAAFALSLLVAATAALIWVLTL